MQRSSAKIGPTVTWARLFWAHGRPDGAYAAYGGRGIIIKNGAGQKQTNLKLALNGRQIKSILAGIKLRAFLAGKTKTNVFFYMLFYVLFGGGANKQIKVRNNSKNKIV